MMRIRSVLFVMPLVVAGCAQVGSPDGGGRDEAPPQVVLAEPPFGTTGFEGHSFMLEFDEFVQLKDARRQVLVSPPLPEPPRVMVRGRNVVVDLGAELLPERTYIVQFGDAVSDLRESNVAKGLQYVFSTGAELDSGRVFGRVEDAWTGEALEGARVLLYADSLPRAAIDLALPDSLRPMPGYVGLVQDSGRFEVGFLPMGAFGCVVVDDVNGNYRADRGEPLAWGLAPMTASADSADWQQMWDAPPLRMDAPPVEPTTYTSGVRLDSSGYFRAAIVGLSTLREGPDALFDAELDVRLEAAGQAQDIGMEGDSIWSSIDLAAFGDTVTLLLTHPSGTDTVKFGSLDPATPPVEVGRRESAVDPGGAFSLRFAPPPLLLDTALCVGTFVLDEDTVAADLSLFSLSGERLHVGPFPPGSKVEVTLLPGAISGPGGSQADTLDGRFSVRRDSDFGAIILDVDSTLAEQEGVLWMLLNGSGQPARDQGLDGDFRFERLLPGKYGVVCIADADGNGRWSGADPERGLMPEEVLHRTEGVDVRAGWEVELQISIHPRP